MKTVFVTVGTTSFDDLIGAMTSDESVKVRMSFINNLVRTARERQRTVTNACRYLWASFISSKPWGFNTSSLTLMSVSMFLNAGINGSWLHRRGASGWQRITCAWSRQLSRTDTSSVSFQRLDHRGHKTLRSGHQSCWWVWANFGPNQRWEVLCFTLYFSGYFLILLLTFLPISVLSTSYIFKPGLLL